MFKYEVNPMTTKFTANVPLEVLSRMHRDAVERLSEHRKVFMHASTAADIDLGRDGNPADIGSLPIALAETFGDMVMAEEIEEFLFAALRERTKR